MRGSAGLICMRLEGKGPGEIDRQRGMRDNAIRSSCHHLLLSLSLSLILSTIPVLSPLLSPLSLLYLFILSRL